jgi:N-acetyl-gamma-glutamyl-phosphate reductase
MKICGGKPMIAAFEDRTHADFTEEPFRIYGLSLNHKHAPEMQKHAGLTHPPLFAPAVGRYRQGMLVEVPLQLAAIPGRPTIQDLHAALQDAHGQSPFVAVAPLAESRAMLGLSPEGLNGTNRMRLHAFGDEDRAQARLVALLDNLGKGAAGAAVQNLNLMIGVEETRGLE